MHDLRWLASAVLVRDRKIDHGAVGWQPGNAGAPTRADLRRARAHVGQEDRCQACARYKNAAPRTGGQACRRGQRRAAATSTPNGANTTAEKNNAATVCTIRRIHFIEGNLVAVTGSLMEVTFTPERAPASRSGSRR
jgi:hypothetical protein